MARALPKLAPGGRVAEDLQGDDPGRCFVDIRQLTNVSDPEIDMNRNIGRSPRVKTRLVAALRWLAPGVYGMESPRRSVDRELEQFSSPWE
jgi:hypothetical protein